eukprot:scaffold44103_cov161-Skeletonema_marinoi.AAC.2
MVIKSVLLLALQLPSRTAHSTIGRKTSRTIMSQSKEYYRHDGVKITFDPYAPGMAEKYGTPGETDNEGFDPYRDSVGAGIYGGSVKRSDSGPVYNGGGYAPSTLMLDDVQGKLSPLLDKYPDLVNDITTGGAQPLHMCGMSRSKENAVNVLIERGADIESLDTYGMTPLHRMASNNLAVGAKMLLDAGADVFHKGKVGVSPMSIAQDSAAHSVIEVLKAAESNSKNKKSSGSMDNVTKLTVMGSKEVPAVNGDYFPKSAESIPTGFTSVCDAQGWVTQDMWNKLNGDSIWFAHSQNESYIYWNKGDKKWWIDGPDGNGVWIVPGPSHAPPAHGWSSISTGSTKSAPMVMTFRKI